MATIETGSLPEIEDHLGEFPLELFDGRFFRSWELVDRYAGEWVVRLVRDLDIAGDLAEPTTVGEIVDRHQFVPGFAVPLDWLLRRLTELGITAAAAGSPREPRYHLARSLPEHHLEEVGAACLENDPANGATLDLLDAAGAAYPEVGRGESTGQEALFGLGHTSLWLAYFHNDNPTYALTNRLAAIAAANRIGGRSTLSILEAGGGAGSATAALLRELEALGALPRISSYRFTEPSPFFRRRSERTLRAAWPKVALSFEGVDLDEPLGAQGIEPGSIDLFYAVNVLHVARRLPRSLAEIRSTLSPDGLLVAGEAIRPAPRRPISTELVFQLLEDFRDVELDPDSRPNPGFLTPAQWRRLFEQAGFGGVEILPDHARIDPLYPRFYAGVVSARP